MEEADDRSAGFDPERGEALATDLGHERRTIRPEPDLHEHHRSVVDPANDLAFELVADARSLDATAGERDVGGIEFEDDLAGPFATAPGRDELDRGSIDHGRAVDTVGPTSKSIHQAASPEGGKRMGVLEEIGIPTVPDDPAPIDDHQLIRDSKQVAEPVTGVDHGRTAGSMKTLEVTEDLRPESSVQRGGRLVEKQEIGPDEQCATDRHPLALAPGEILHVAIEERTEFEDSDQVVGIAPPGAGSEAQVPRDREMREETKILEDHPDPAAIDPDVDASLRIEQRPTVDSNQSPVRSDQARDDREQGRLPRSGGSEDPEGPRRGGERDLEAEAWPVEDDVDLDQAAPPLRRAMRRESSSEASNAAKETTMAINTSRIAPASPPGVWTSV